MTHEFKVKLDLIDFKAEYSKGTGFLGYLRFSAGFVEKTIEVKPGVFADVDPFGNLLGLEFVPGLTSSAPTNVERA